MAERIAICSAKPDNRILGYIEGCEAFDLLGRRRADYNPNTGLLYDLLDGGVVGYVTFDSKFAGLSKSSDEMFPKTHKLTPPQSPGDYVNNLSVGTMREAGEQPLDERTARPRAVPETKSASPDKAIEPPIEVSSSYTCQETTEQKLFSNSSNWTVAAELVGHDGAETDVSASVDQIPSRAAAEQEPHLESFQPGAQSASSGSVVNEVSGRRAAEHDFIIRENIETPMSVRLLQHEETQPRQPRSPSPPSPERNEPAERTPSPMAHADSPDERAESKPPSSDTHVLGVVETFMQRVADYVDSTHNNNIEPPIPSPSQQDEVANWYSNFDSHQEMPGDGYPCAPGEGFVEREAQKDTFSSTNRGLVSSERGEEGTTFSSDSDDRDVGREDRGTSLVEVESGNQTNGINETPRPTFSEKGEQEGVDLDVRSDDNAPGERDLSEPYPKDHGAMVEWGEFESKHELSSIKESSSTSVSGRDHEARANPESKSDDHSDRHAARLGPFGAGNSFAHAVSGDELNNITETPGELLSSQGKAEVTPFSEPPGDSAQERFESRSDANSTGVVVSAYVPEQCNTQDSDAVPGIEEKRSLPWIEQNKAEQPPLPDLDDDSRRKSTASVQDLEYPPSAPGEADMPKHLPVEQSAPNLAKAFFEGDLEHAVGMVRTELAKSGYRANPNLERAVDIFRKEFETELYRTDPGKSDPT
jgi:hypothetical protein